MGAGCLADRHRARPIAIVLACAWSSVQRASMRSGARGGGLGSVRPARHRGPVTLLQHSVTGLWGCASVVGVTRRVCSRRRAHDRWSMVDDRWSMVGVFMNAGIDVVTQKKDKSKFYETMLDVRRTREEKEQEERRT